MESASFDKIVIFSEALALFCLDAARADPRFAVAGWETFLPLAATPRRRPFQWSRT
jgi:hypothetical protein